MPRIRKEVRKYDNYQTSVETHEEEYEYLRKHAIIYDTWSLSTYPDKERKLFNFYFEDERRETEYVLRYDNNNWNSGSVLVEVGWIEYFKWTIPAISRYTVKVLKREVVSLASLAYKGIKKRSP